MVVVPSTERERGVMTGSSTARATWRKHRLYISLVAALAPTVPLACGQSNQNPELDAGGVDSSSSLTIGPDGGRVSVNGVALDIPAGALSSPVEIQVTRDDGASIPSGLRAISPVFRFSPDHLAFLVPATVHFTAPGAPNQATIHWSDSSGDAFTALPTNWDGSDAATTISHFSRGFVGVAADGDSDGGTDGTAGALVPSNIPQDICVTAATQDLDIAAGQTIDVDTSDDAQCDLHVTGVAPEICVVKRRTITVASTGTLTAHGSRAIAFVATNHATIDGTIDVSAKLNVNGPGAPEPAGAGTATSCAWFAGGGAGYGTPGGGAGNCGVCDMMFADASAGLRGASYGSAAGVPLRSGAAGASVTYPNDGGPGAGGGGGGALQLVSCGSLHLGATAKILAGGGGGGGGYPTSSCGGGGGGGGGSGGTVLLEGLTVTVKPGATLIANGGGGGSGGGSGNTTGPVFGNNGGNGADSIGPAAGGRETNGAVITKGSPGGNGGAEGFPPLDGASSQKGGPGGGGGAVGRVRINAFADSGVSIEGGVFSPRPDVGSL